ncbi:calmodulin-beta-like [Culicoides brevitarsis]|uniref:calmodulin-beta-like n=1 Tax=Culicoides brevitarsis TaxID=469753 RepID=UPI00307C8E6A
MPFPINKDTLENYQKSFILFDKNGDGEIDVKELVQLMRAIGQNPSIAQAENMIFEIDIDGTGTINFEEFITLMERFGKDQKETELQLRSAFQVFDKNKDGFISVHELKEILMNLGEKMTDNEFEDLIAEADVDGDGRIDYEEFIAMMTRNIGLI